MTRNRCLRAVMCAIAASAGFMTLTLWFTKENAIVLAAESQSPKHTNRLVHETSPYLLQHAHNPVDWYPWGEEALAKAKAENKPIFLSIGYSACHWCHVMERESFENEEIAAFLNEHFVSIKVDREERPDLDEIYMAAVMAIAGNGGWPMTVFLTPDLKPFFGGTYFPPEDTFGRRGFKSLIAIIAEKWGADEARIRTDADNVTEWILHSTTGKGAPDGGKLSYALIEGATEAMARNFDETNGGWGGAPKFPSAPSIELLLREYRRTKRHELLEHALLTLKKMAYGGMYDQLGGGFHRYSVDDRWLVPHFEKMLYDNGQLAQVYLEAYQLTKDPLFARVARETLDYQLRDMTDPLGPFHASEDADSEGEEGKFYIWTRDEIMALLGAENGELFCAYYGVEAGGNFGSHEDYHAGRNILHIARDLETLAREYGIAVEELDARIGAAKTKLLDARSRRARPGRDDKVITSWNGLMISAMAKGYQVLGGARYREAAENAARFVLDTMRKDGRLLRTYRNGEAKLPGYLDDYAFMTVALVDLYEATFDSMWIEEADRLANVTLDHFWDKKSGGFYFTSDEHTNLIARTKPSYDGSEPSGGSMAALAFLRLGALLDKPDYRAKGMGVLETNAGLLEKAPQSFLKSLAALSFALDTPAEIALIAPKNSAEASAFLGVIHSRFIPNKVIALLDPAAADGGMMAQTPLLAGKKLVNGKPAAYVCENYACKQPVTDAEALGRLLDSLTE